MNPRNLKIRESWRGFPPATEIRVLPEPEKSGDELYGSAVRLIRRSGRCGVPQLMRAFNFGRFRAMRMMDDLERNGELAWEGKGMGARLAVAHPEKKEVEDGR